MKAEKLFQFNFSKLESQKFEPLLLKSGPEHSGLLDFALRALQAHKYKNLNSKYIHFIRANVVLGTWQFLWVCSQGKLCLLEQYLVREKYL